MKRNLFLPLCLVAVSACTQSVEPSSDSPTDEPTASTAQEIATDPSDVAESGYCYNSYIWNGTRGRVYYPSNGGCSASVYSPLVVLFHGTNYSYTGYHYLLRHLARNGFIAVSVDVLADSQNNSDHLAAAEQGWDFVHDYLWSNWSKSAYINPNAVGVIGHSRGGGTARALAHYLEGDPTFHVKSVVTLAPTGSDTLYIKGTQAESYLSLYGTSDSDVAPGGVYKHFDFAGTETSQFDPSWDSQVTYKAMKLIDGASHAGFHDTGSADQQAVTRGYVLAFLKAHLAGDATWYEDYVRGDAVPHGWADPVVSQYADGFYRRTIDNFQDGSLPTNTLGGPVIQFGTTTTVPNLGATADPHPHNTRVLQVSGSSQGAYVQWNIPDGKRDASAFEWLSLRLGQISGTAASDVFVRIRNGNTWSSEVRITDHGQIAQPLEMCVSGTGVACLSIKDQFHMGTVRIPLSALGAHDDVRDVRIVLRNNALNKTFIADNLEFSEWVLKP
ncbi:MAG: hypothetical protein H6716_08925 [Polyangiaceae bacterium]|nr:hypothetical protein [Polyangiaceae bacterium]